jgi:hypothetical protein
MRCGGARSREPAQHALSGPLEPEAFGAAAMRTGSKDLMAMKVAELKEELAARDEPVSGNKAWLRRRLHAAILRGLLAAA